MMLSVFEKAVYDFSMTQSLFTEGDSVLAAVSGGADSVAMLSVLRAFRENGLTGKLLAVHINHNLRGSGADDDQAHTEYLCEEMGIDYVSFSIDVKGLAEQNGLSIETAGRKLRIQKLSETARRFGCGLIATGHHKDDNAETVIDRLRRGTGFRGLAGIEPKKTFADGTTFIRPLLCTARQRIIAYLDEVKLEYCVDQTNKDVSFTRNRIRHQIMPMLQKDSERDISEMLFELSANARQLKGRLDEKCRTLRETILTQKNNQYLIEKAGFAGLSQILKVHFVQEVLTEMKVGLRAFTAEHYTNIVSIPEKPAGIVLELPGGCQVLNDYGHVVFTKAGSNNDNKTQKKRLLPPDQLQSVEIAVPGTTNFGKFTISANLYSADGADLEGFRKNKTKNVEWFDFDTIKETPRARTVSDEDRFVPFGHNKPKKISKFLADQKFPHIDRKDIFVIEDEEKIVWLAPLRPGGITAVTKNTSRILQLEVSGPKVS